MIGIKRNRLSVEAYHKIETEKLNTVFKFAPFAKIVTNRQKSAKKLEMILYNIF